MAGGLSGGSIAMNGPFVRIGVACAALMFGALFAGSQLSSIGRLADRPAEEDDAGDASVGVPADAGESVGAEAEDGEAVAEGDAGLAEDSEEAREDEEVAEGDVTPEDATEKDATEEDYTDEDLAKGSDPSDEDDGGESREVADGDAEESEEAEAASNERAEGEAEETDEDEVTEEDQSDNRKKRKQVADGDAASDGTGETDDATDGRSPEESIGAGEGLSPMSVSP
jgi:hypothetical protein